MDLFRKTLGPVKKVIEDAGLKKNCIDEIVLVGGSTRIPKVQQLIKDMFDGKEPKMGVNPDEAVVCGAAVEGAILNSHEWWKPYLLLPVIPFSLGVETAGGVMTKMIPRNSFPSGKMSRVFTTSQDQQTTVTIKVFRGERGLTKDCHELVRFDLSGIPPAPRGVPQIEVTFDLSRVLHVKAEDKATKRSQSITVSTDEGLTREVIEKMYKEAKEMEEEDERAMEMIDVRNLLGTYIYRRIGSRINNKDKQTLMIDSDDKEKTESTLKEAEAVCCPVIKQVY